MKHLEPSVWNELPLSICVRDHVPRFKKNLKIIFGGVLNFITVGRLGKGKELKR